ncbi:MAG TPA: hypothetical protein VK138_10675 [Acidiferrobacterales bacterium]|nr:hypothetical protein [Acidiferrobacterales bacterium]
MLAAADPLAGATDSVFNLLNTPTLNHRVQVDSGVLVDLCQQQLRNA